MKSKEQIHATVVELKQSKNNFRFLIFESDFRPIIGVDIEKTIQAAVGGKPRGYALVYILVDGPISVTSTIGKIAFLFIRQIEDFYALFIFYSALALRWEDLQALLPELKARVIMLNAVDGPYSTPASFFEGNDFKYKAELENLCTKTSGENSGTPEQAAVMLTVLTNKHIEAKYIDRSPSTSIKDIQRLIDLLKNESKNISLTVLNASKMGVDE